MTRAAYFNCFSGIAGDMALGGLLDAGADLEYVRDILGALDIKDWSLDVEVVFRNGIRATRAIVTENEHRHDVSRTFAVIRDLIEAANLPERIRRRSLRIFEALAAVEGHLHGQEPETVHFHEVGGIDAIVDIVGTCAALESLAIDQIYASSVALGTGTIRAHHGLLPNPAPAVVALLRNATTHGVDQPHELTTPTGAAILSALADRFGPAPRFAPLETSGFGAGSRDTPGLANVTNVMVGTVAPLDQQPTLESMTVLETNVDDVTGEALAYVIARLIDNGAADAWATPIVMKKGRPAHALHALVTPERCIELAQLLMNETGTLGVRIEPTQRLIAARTFAEVNVDGHIITMKVANGRAKPEYEDVVEAAKALDRPLRVIADTAQAAWLEEQRKDPSAPL